MLYNANVKPLFMQAPGRTLSAHMATLISWRQISWCLILRT